MLIYPINLTNNKINNRSFKGKDINLERIFNSPEIKRELCKIKNNGDAKNMFLGLSVLAGSILAELAFFADKYPDIKNFADRVLNHLGLKNKEKLLEEMNGLFESVLNLHETDITPILEENPKRNKYLSILSHYPNLEEKYKILLTKATQEPDNKDNKFIMETLEVAFEMMTKNDSFKYYESYFETLDTDFSDRLDDIAKTIITAYKNNMSPTSYLQKLNSKKLTPEEVTKWANAKNLSYEEFLKCKFLDSELLTNISNIKLKNDCFTITSMLPFTRYKTPLYTFKLKFKNDTPIIQKLKTISDVHTALYGPISFNEDADINARYLNSDIRTELTDNILKDKRVDSVYAFVKYIKPEVLSEINLTSDDVRYLSKEDETYKKIKEICSKEIYSLNPEDPRLFELYELLQNKDIFGDLFTTTHSRLRFITRFVLKNNQNSSNLLYKCKAKVDILKKELDTHLNKYNYICYANKKGFAPQFYHYESKLGHFIKITLNPSGSIHTIYEDFNRELKEKQDKI